jgi:proteasome lid subunit RPN8/RPN11
MKIREITGLPDITTLVPPQTPDQEISGGYASDLLSCVMARAGAGNIWVTLQTHPNVVAVASLLDLAGVIITECADIAKIDAATIEKARTENVALFATPLTTFTIVARLARAGVPGIDEG